MDINNLNPLVKRMATELMSVKTSMPLQCAVASVNYKLANLASQIHVKIDTRCGFKPAPVNIYSLMLLNSGAGKNSSLTLLDTWYFDASYSKIKNKIFPYYKRQALDNLERANIDRELHNWSSGFNTGTQSGIMAYAETFHLCKFGSFNVEVDEFGTAVTSKKELLEDLLSPYDNGDFKPTAKRSDTMSIEITGLPVNLYCFGNKVRLLDGDSAEKQFITLLDEGYARRMIFVDDNSTQTTKTPTEVLEEFKASENIQARSKDLEKMFEDTLRSENFNRVLKLTDEAMMVYATIKSEGDNYVEENKGLSGAVIADMSERHFKTAKLAGIYAFFEGCTEVTDEHMNQAFEVIKESSNVLMKLRNVKLVHERLLDKLLWERNKITTQHMLNYTFIPKSWTKKIFEILELTKQLASQKGYEWIEDTVDGVTYYQVIDNSKNLKKEMF